ncbi:MAG: peptide deformylase [Patescibacteria group bacterium]
MTPIVQNPNPVLRKVAKEVPEKTIKSPKIIAVLERMKEALDSQEDGVAIAAPQIGESLRIFVITERALEISDELAEGKKIAKNPEKVYGHLVFINPVISKISKTKAVLEEGCLSVRYAYGKVNRSTKATVKAFNEKGEKFTRGGSGLLAQIFQHEIDHLNGILFIDTAKEVKEVPPEKTT